MNDASRTRTSPPSPPGNGRRNRLGATLIALAGVVFVAAALAFYVDRNVFETARFADHAEASLGSAAVRQVAAEQITREIVLEVDPDAVAVKPVIDAVMAAAIDTTAFKRLFRSAVIEAHRAAVSNRFDDAVVVLANVGVLLDQALSRLSPELARRIPPNLDAKLLSVADGTWESDAAAAARRADRLSWVLPLVAMLLLAGGVVIAGERRQALARCGLALAGAGSVLTVAYFFAKSFVVHEFEAGVDRDAAEAVWSEFAGGFLFLAVGLATAGSALAAAASGSLRPADVDARARRIVRVMTRPPDRVEWRVAWALAVLALGVWALISPGDVLQSAAFLGGFYLVFRGANELIALAMPARLRGAGEPAPTPIGGPPRARAREPASTRTDEPSPTRAGAHFAAFAATVLVVCFAAAAVGAAIVGEEGLETLGLRADTHACNGAESLCEKRLNEVTFAATHNSMSDKTYPGGWYFPEQDGPISRQLADGVRALMLDVYYGFPGRRVYTDSDLSSPNVRNALVEEFGTAFVAAGDRIRRTLSKPQGARRHLYLCHGFCELGAIPIEEALAQIRDFLDANPREVLVLVFEDYVATRDLADALAEAGIDEAAFKFKGDLESDPAQPWPTLREMVASEQRVLVLAERNSSPAVPWIRPAYELMQETPFSFKSVRALAAPSSCDAARGDPANPLFLINHWIDTAPAPRPSNAGKVNARRFLLRRVRRCERVRKRRANLIAVDFYRHGDLVRVVDELNGVE